MIDTFMLILLGAGFALLLVTEIFHKFFERHRGFMYIGASMAFVPIVYIFVTLAINGVPGFDNSEVPKTVKSAEKSEPKLSTVKQKQPKPVITKVKPKRTKSANAAELPIAIKELIKELEGDGLVVTKVEKIKAKRVEK